MKRFFAISLLGFIMLLATSCASRSMLVQSTADMSTENTQQSVSEIWPNANEPTYTADSPDNMPPTFVKHLDYSMNNGKLLVDNALSYTIENSRLITSGSRVDLPLDNFLWGFTLQTTWDKQTRKYPEGITSDGCLAEGFYMVILDVECTNLNAMLEDNEKTSYYGDPFLFRADGLLELFDDVMPENNLYHQTSINYFSTEGKQFSDHPCLFSVSVGETTRFTIGFLNYNPNVDVSKLRIVTSVVNANLTGFEEIEFHVD